MRRGCMFFVLMLLIPFVFWGCQMNSDSETSNNEITKVSLSHFKEFGEINPDFFVVYEDEETIETFQNAISNAVKQEGTVDISEAEYDLEIIYEDETKQGYHLWVGKEGEKSTLMRIEDTNTIYTIAEEMTEQLQKLVK